MLRVEKFSVLVPKSSHFISSPGLVAGGWFDCLRGEPVPKLAGDLRAPDFVRKGDCENELLLAGGNMSGLLPLEVPVMSAKILVLVAARISDGRLLTLFSGEPRAAMSSWGSSMNMSKAALLRL